MFEKLCRIDKTGGFMELFLKSLDYNLKIVYNKCSESNPYLF